jgi:hypothetical protein
MAPAGQSVSSSLQLGMWKTNKMARKNTVFGTLQPHSLDGVKI